jgi:hypothetical protein
MSNFQTSPLRLAAVCVGLVALAVVQDRLEEAKLKQEGHFEITGVVSEASDSSVVLHVDDIVTTSDDTVDMFREGHADTFYAAYQEKDCTVQTPGQEYDERGAAIDLTDLEQGDRVAIEGELELSFSCATGEFRNLPVYTSLEVLHG